MLTVKTVMLGAVLGAMQAVPTADVNDLAWMAGYWLDCSNGREASHIRADDQGRLTYFAQPDGAPPTPFVLIESWPGRAKFRNLDPEDFPRHILYERDGDVLTARIDGEIGGEERIVQWRFDRAELNARCPG